MNIRHNKKCLQLRHPKFDPNGSLSVRDMLVKASNGIPLSIPVKSDDRFPINNHKFFNDSFDVIDVLNKDLESIKIKRKQRESELAEIRKKEVEEFNLWKKEKESILLNKQRVDNQQVE